MTTAKERITFDTVREIGRTLPNAEETRYWGSPALTVKGKMFAVRTAHSSAERNSMSVPVGFSRRDALIRQDPNIFYLKSHYERYPVVLARLSRMDRSRVRRLLQYAHRVVSSGAVDPDEPMSREELKKARGARKSSARSARKK
jgi:hypothetical protein